MKALLLAAGLGSRLRPITNDIPKCLVPIAGKPLLAYWLEELCDQGIDEILINTHYKSEKVNEFIHHSPWKSNVTLVHEYELLGTAGTVKANKSFFDKAPFLVAHADNLTFFDLSDFNKKHKSYGSQVILTMMSFKSDNPKSCGILELDKNGIVHKFHEKVESPPGNLANGAIYLMNWDIFDILETLEVEKPDLSHHLIPKVLKRIGTYENTTYLRDIGTPESLLMAENYILGQ